MVVSFWQAFIQLRNNTNRQENVKTTNVDKETAENGLNHIQDPFQRLFMGTSGTKTGSLPGKSIRHKAFKHRKE